MTGGPSHSAASGDRAQRNALTLRRLGIDSYSEAIIFMRADCHICRAVGLTAQSRVEVALGERALVATLYTVTGELLGDGEAGLSNVA